MEEKGFEQSKKDVEFENLLNLAKEGNTEALESILLFFDEDISFLARFIKMPYEDAKNSIALEFIEILALYRGLLI